MGKSGINPMQLDGEVTREQILEWLDEQGADDDYTGDDEYMEKDKWQLDGDNDNTRDYLMEKYKKYDKSNNTEEK
jgi:hypothetical protein